MVSLPLVRKSNSHLKSFSSPVAVFVGATQGIGLSTLQQYATLASVPKIYIVGRSEPVGVRIIDDLQARNAEGNYVFLKAEVSLLENVDQVCREIKRREKKMDLLFMSPGYISFGGRNETSEGLDTIHTLRYYARALFVIRLLPLLRNSPCARVVFILRAGGEGGIFPDDLELKHHYSLLNAASTASTMTSLFCEEAAARNPGVAFVHSYPGLVNTGIIKAPFWPWLGWLLERTLIPLMNPFMVDLTEIGERSVFHATSARYPARDAPVDGPSVSITTARPEAIAAWDRESKKIPGVPLPEGLSVAKGAGNNGQMGGGAYLLNWDGENLDNKVMARYREEGMGSKVWDHTCGIFERVCGS